MSGENSSSELLEEPVDVGSGKFIKFCGQKRYRKTKMKCHERLQYMTNRYHVSDQEAKIGLLQNEDCICDDGNKGGSEYSSGGRKEEQSNNGGGSSQGFAINVNGETLKFCGEALYRKMGMSCHERLEYMSTKYHISEREATIHLLENKDCVCDEDDEDFFEDNIIPEEANLINNNNNNNYPSKSFGGIISISLFITTLVIILGCMRGFHSGRRSSTSRLSQGTIRRCMYLAIAVLAFVHVAITIVLMAAGNHHTKQPATTSVKTWGDGRWDRLLIGIFSYDSPNEFDLRMINRETHLSYFKKHVNDDRKRDTICSLQELLNNESLVNDRRRCQIVYTFVMGGGIHDDNLRHKFGRGLKLDSVNGTIRTRCLWEDPDCGGTDVRQWTMGKPKFDASPKLLEEIKENKDITFLSISENHELGKTDTWFTYAAMLTKNRPNLRIRFIGKLDSDNFLNYAAFMTYFKRNKQYIKERKFLYGGYVIHKGVCSTRSYDYICKRPEFIAPLFIPGALVYLSTPLAQHVFMDGTTLERKKQVWIHREDVQLGNMAYSDPSIVVETLNHQKNGGQNINKHCFSDPVLYRHEFYKKILGITENGTKSEDVEKTRRVAHFKAKAS